MTAKSDRAQVTLIQIGLTEIEGLLLSDGRFAISVSQVCSVFQFLNKNAVREVQALLGNDFQFLKTRSTLLLRDYLRAGRFASSLDL